MHWVLTYITKGLLSLEMISTKTGLYRLFFLFLTTSSKLDQTRKHLPPAVRNHLHGSCHRGKKCGQVCCVQHTQGVLPCLWCLCCWSHKAHPLLDGIRGNRIICDRFDGDNHGRSHLLPFLLLKAGEKGENFM